LATITGSADTLLTRKGLPAERQEELLRTIQGEADRLNRIVRNVLSMTRLESGAIQVKKDPQSIEEITGAVIDHLSDRLRRHSLAVNIPPVLPLIPFDPLLIEQVLTNLLENAIQHAPAGSAIEISAAIQGQDVIVTVGDRGPGIPPGQELKIFQKFVRGERTAGGVGLGLPICRAIVEAHGGRIWADNRTGGGASFYFSLPLDGRAVLSSEEIPQG
jgi:two-component system sensor histidine kinase KdpD